MGIIETKKKVNISSDLAEKPSNPDFLKARKAHYKNEYVLAKKALKKSQDFESFPELNKAYKIPKVHKPQTPDFIKARKSQDENEYEFSNKELNKSQRCESDPELDEYERIPQRKASFVEPVDAHDEESKSKFFEKFTKKTQVEEFTYAKKELSRLDPKLLVSSLSKDNGIERKRLSLDNLEFASGDIKRRYSENIIK